MTWYVYLLECGDDSLYTGITNDVEKRMRAHSRGKGSTYVRWKKFGRLLYTIEAADKVEAAKLEYKLKQLSRDEKIKFFLNNPMLRYSAVKK